MDLTAVLDGLEGAADGPLSRLVHGDSAEQLIAPLRGSTPDSLVGAGGHALATQAVLAGIWVAADLFDEAHEVAQALPDEWGAWWHAILHRREPDASNALYWYRKVNPPATVKSALGAQALGALGAVAPQGLEPLATALRTRGMWEPVPYVSACERGQAGKLSAEAVGALIALQRLEWRAWMNHCITVARAG